MLHSECIDAVTGAIPLLERFVDLDTADLARRNRITLKRYGHHPWREDVRVRWLNASLTTL